MKLVHFAEITEVVHKPEEQITHCKEGLHAIKDEDEMDYWGGLFESLL